MDAEDSVDGLLSTMYHVLRAPRRRHVIQFVSGGEQELHTVKTLARKIAAKEQNIPLEHATGEPYRNAYNALTQTHLPTLARGNILIYDPNRQTVSRGPNFTIAALLVAINQPAILTLYNPKPDDEDDSEDRNATTD